MRQQPDRAAGGLVEDGTALLIARHRGHTDFFVVPGGKVEPGETPQPACAREVKEEVSLTVEAGRLLARFPDEGRTQHCFAVGRTGGRVRLCGGPEVRRAIADNSYDAVWLTAEELTDIDLRPREALAIILGAMTRSGPL